MSSNSGVVFQSPFIHVGCGILHFHSKLHRLESHEMVSTTIAAIIVFQLISFKIQDDVLQGL